MNIKATYTETKTGRCTVRFTCPITGAPKLRRFRNRATAVATMEGIQALAGYWSNSATASICADYAAGNVVEVAV